MINLEWHFSGFSPWEHYLSVSVNRGWKPLPQKFDIPWERLPAAIKTKISD
jgi:hypothetical protein